MKNGLLLVLVWLLPVVASAQVTVFSDSFTQADGADPAWTSVNGNWVVTSGTYNATVPGSGPTALSLVTGLNFTEGTVAATVYGAMDGALVIRSNGIDAGTGVVNGVMFVYRANDAYFHVAVGGGYGGFLSGFGHVALPSDGFRVSVTATGNTFLGTITSMNGLTVYGTSSLTDSTYTSGNVGLYSNRDNATGRYDDFSVSVAAVPEPSSFAVFAGLAVLGLIGVSRRAGKRRPA
jgi:hypothetical protein